MKKILLHVCCAPCLLGCIDSLRGYEVTLFFYNPNIHPSGEYLKRLFFVRKVAQKYNFQLVVGDYDFNQFFEISKGKEMEKEGGERCSGCFELRLEKVAKVAKDKRFDMFTTTLSVSPHKDFEKIKAAARKLENKYGVEFLAKNFNQEGGMKISIELCKSSEIYRQNYCGCMFSLNNRITQKQSIISVQ